jgi:hypothetical protein
MKKLLVLITLTFSVAGLQAAEHGFQASLTPDIAVHPKTDQINGLALSIWGENPQHGVALGFVNGSTGDSKGFTWGLFNYADSYTGVSWGLVNYSKVSFVGWQGGNRHTATMIAMLASDIQNHDVTINDTAIIAMPPMSGVTSRCFRA